MPCYYDCEDYFLDLPHNDYDAKSLLSEDFDWDNFTLNDNLGEADKKNAHITALPYLRLVGMYFYPLPFQNFVCIYGFD